MSVLKPLSVLDCSDYRTYLQNWFALKKEQKYPVSLRSFVRKTPGISVSHLAFVLAKERHLSQESATIMAAALGLTQIESEYFFALIAKETAKTEKQLGASERELVLLKTRHSQAVINDHIGTFLYNNRWVLTLS